MDGGSVELELELVGLAATKKRLADLQKFTGNQVDKMKRSFAGLGKSIRGALNNSLANSITGAALFGGLVLGLKEATAAALELEQVQRKLNVTLGEAGTQTFNFAADLARKYGLSILKTASAMGSFTAAATQAGVSLKDQEDLFTALTKSSVAFGLSQQSTDRVFTAVEQIAAKGVVSMEELRQQLGEQLPIAAAAGAKGLGVTVRELYKLIESGDLSSGEFLPALSKGLNELTGDLPDTATTKLGRLKTAIEELKLAAGGLTVGPAVGIAEGLTKAIEAAKTLGVSLKVDTLGTLRRIGAQFLNISENSGLDENIGIVNAAQDIELLEKQFSDLGLTQDQIIDKYKEIAKVSKLDLGSLELFTAVANGIGGDNKDLIERVRLKREEIRLSQLETQINNEQSDQRKELQALAPTLAKIRFGDNTSQTVTSIQAVIKEVKKLDSASKQYAKAYAAMDGSLAKRKEAELSLAKFEREKQNTYAVLGIESDKIRKAFDDASKKVKDISRELKDSAQSLAEIQANKKGGISQFQGAKFGGEAERAGRKSLLALAIQARNKASSNIRSTQGLDAVRDFTGRNSNARLGQRSNAKLSEFIKAINTELDAQDQVVETQKKLESATKDLAGVMKAIEKSGFDMNASNLKLSSSITDLVGKDWTVKVNVPGASASGDVVEVQNALS
jgi:tape measure domain-containing protein